jgi:putative methyltransferase
VLIYELLFSSVLQGENKIVGGGKAKKSILEYRTQLNSALARLKIRKKAKDNNELLPEHIRNPSKLKL